MKKMSGNIILLTFLYFIQGLPYGFQVQFLPVYLRSKGVDLKHVGFMKLLHMPWLCKTLWAPMVDKISTKRKWLLGSIMGLIVTCLYGGFIPPDNLVLLCSVLLLLNIFASTQDIAVDSIAVSVLSRKELGHGNTAQVVGYKIGSIFGGGLLVWFMNFLGWTGLFLVLALLYIEALMFVFVSPVLRDFENQQRHGKVYDADKSDCESDVFGDDDTQDDISSDVTDVSESLPDLLEQSSPSRDNGNSDKRTSESKPDLLADNIALVESGRHSHNSPPHSFKNSDMDRTSEPTVFSGQEQHLSDENITPSAKRRQRQGKAQLNQTDSSEEDSASYCGPELSQEEIDSLQSAAEYVHFVPGEETLALNVTEGPKRLISDVINTPGTKWMISYVLIYKLGEQGALGMLPLFLVDHGVDMADVTFWTALVGQGISIVGSILGGFLADKYCIPVHLFLQQLSLLRLTPLGIQVLLVWAWAFDIYVIDKFMYTWIAIGSTFVLLLISGIVTTVTFTFMMQCSKMAPPGVQATHYSTLSTCEVFGKLAFTAITGWLVESLGYPVVFLIFVALSAVVMVLFRSCPPALKHEPLETSEKVKKDQ